MCDTEKEKPKKSGANLALNIAIRIVNMGLAVAAASLMATATECTVVLPNPSTSTLRTHIITYHDFPSYVYLQIANTVSAILVGIAIFLSVWKKGEAKLLLSFIDAVVPTLLDSATGAAIFTVGNMKLCAAPGRHVSVCAAAGTGTFCTQVNLAIHLSIGAVASVKLAKVAKSEQLLQFISGAGSMSDDDDGCGHGCNSQ